MSCVNCVKSVEDHVGKLAGVTSVKVTLDKGTVDVSFDEVKQNIVAIQMEIENQGYQVSGNEQIVVD